MTHYKYDRLSAQDNDFLLWEQEGLPMHGGTVQIFESGDLMGPDGGVDFEKIKRGIETILHKIPRYRQKIAWLPSGKHGIWVDDPHFNLDYHIRHTALPRPGSDEQLKKLAARIVERPLDRSRPLWEMWVIEGLDGDRFSTISKTHHCMVDGSAGVDLVRNLYSMSPEYTLGEPRRFIPRPHPSEVELRRDELVRLLGMPVRAAGELRNFVAATGDLPKELMERAWAVGEMARLKIVPTSDTPLNGKVGPHRILEWFSLDLEDVKAIRKSLGCSVNDVVLGVVTGAVRQFLIGRQVRPEEIEFRVATPVNVRPQSAEGKGGNHVSTWIVPLPVGEPDPLGQVAAIHESTQALKRSHQAAAIEMVEAVNEWIPIDLQSLSEGTQNMYVTNVPGPAFPLYLLGARLKEIFVQAPLIENVGVTVCVLSYNGRICWGLCADYDRIPDLEAFCRQIAGSFAALAEAAGVPITGGQAGDGE